MAEIMNYTYVFDAEAVGNAVRNNYRHAVATVQWTVAGIFAFLDKEKASTFRLRLSYVGITYFHGQSPDNYRRRK